MGSFLSSINPLNWLQTILVWIVIALLFTIMGFFGGCQYKQNQWDAEKFREMAKTASVEKHDAADQVKANVQSAEAKQAADQGKTFVKEELAKKKPLVRVVAKVETAPVVVGSTEKTQPQVITQPGTTKDEATGVYLTADFMRLYDVSLNPGLAEIRTGGYEKAGSTTLDEGFEKVVIPNNEKCAADRAQLLRLITRIEQKQQLYNSAYQ